MAFPRTVDLLNATSPLGGLTIDRDVPYGPAARHRMDIYRPTHAAGPLPVLVWFYGGAWQNGERGIYRFVAAPLARAGMVVVVPDYRLFPEVRFPAFIEDGALAVADVRQQAASWGGDAARLFLAGHSAGAYIAAMLAVAPGYLEAVGLSRTDVAGAVGLGGPYDFLPIRDADIRLVFASAGDDLRPTQPISHVDGGNAPLLLLHGDRDVTCYPRNALALAARIRAAGGPVALRSYRHVGHMGIVLGFAPLGRAFAPTFADTVRFVRGAWDEAGSRSIGPVGWQRRQPC